MDITTKADSIVSASIETRKDTSHGVGLVNHYHLEAFDSEGNLKWEEKFSNLVVDVGLDDLLDKYLKGSAYTAAFYVGITDSTPTVVAADTMASHAGWTEVIAYDEVTRPVLTLGTVTTQSVDNSASVAVFTVNAGSTTIGGAFVSTDNTKSGTTGTLYSAGSFTGGDKILDASDILNVTVTLTSAAV